MNDLEEPACDHHWREHHDYYVATATRCQECGTHIQAPV